MHASGAMIRQNHPHDSRKIHLKILVGLSVAAMDRHLFGFLERAGIGKLNYERSQEIVHRTADLMKLDRALLDHSIWLYMSGGKAASLMGGPCDDA
jgi:hypothetical protein